MNISSPLVNLNGGTLSLGSVVVTAGTTTAGTLTNLVSGTINALAAGTVTAGTVTLANVAGLFPVTAAGSDATPNPTLTQVENFNMIYNTSTWDRLKGVQGDSAGATGIAASGPVGFNEFNYDRIRNNTNLTFLSSSARVTGTQTQSDQTNYNARGLKMYISVTSVTGGGTIIPEIDVKDSAGGGYVSLLTSVPITAAGTKILTVYPGITNTANVGTSDILGRTYRLLVAQTSGTVTYSVGWDMIL